MNTVQVNRWLIIAIVLLLLINTATIALLWSGKNDGGKHPGPGGEAAAEFIIRETKMDDAQRQQYRNLVQQHREAAEELRREMGRSKENFFDLLQQTNVPDSVLRAASLQANERSQELDILTFRHFAEVRKILRPEQQQVFDRIIKEALRMMAPPPGRPR
ncbi:MAG TPA: periplasmic heavy metal sensor [Chitinophagaceae bacterium]|jgi:Spy/CpxP family protein refolding chaperone|nr:periplasmic heavy metal sensor [Chitinophagaceae bacterium]